jgi:hypothetical protein
MHQGYLASSSAPVVAQVLGIDITAPKIFVHVVFFGLVENQEYSML